VTAPAPVDDIVTLWVLGALAQGDRTLTARQLATELRVPVTLVRDALARLAETGRIVEPADAEFTPDQDDDGMSA
jgi:DNA-binding GntR family transcriptional regulator